MAHAPKEQKPLGITDTIVGAVLFVGCVYLLKYLLDAAVPGLLSQETMLHVIISGLMFLAVWALIGNYLFGPYLALFEEREQRTEGDEKLAAERRKESAELQRSIDEALRLARLEGIKERDAKVDAAKADAQSILDAAEAASAKELAKAQQEIARLSAEANAALAQESERLADLVVSRALASQPGQTLH